MKRRVSISLRTFPLLCALAISLASPRPAGGEPTQAAASAFNAYIADLEARLNRQHESKDAFLSHTLADPERVQRLRNGETIVERLTPSSGSALPGALLHHWRGTAFAPGATAAGFERLLKDFDAYPQRFAPQVLQAQVVADRDGRLEAWMRVRQKHVLTVVMDSTYDVTFGGLDAQDRYSASRSTHLYEIEGAGTAHERRLSPSQEHGFLWRQNTYWTYEERDGGLYLQIESVSLSRSIPTGLGWALQGFVESVPRESLEFTLRSACHALRSRDPQ